LKTVLVTANKGERPYLKHLTLQYIIKFISCNVKKNLLSKPAFKHF
jgi:hypothetical protein